MYVLPYFTTCCRVDQTLPHVSQPSPLNRCDETKVLDIITKMSVPFNREVPDSKNIALRTYPLQLMAVLPLGRAGPHTKKRRAGAAVQVECRMDSVQDV